MARRRSRSISKRRPSAARAAPIITFEIPAADRMRLLEGLDDIGLTLKHTDEIKAWEQRMAAAQPWLQQRRTAGGDSPHAPQ